MNQTLVPFNTLHGARAWCVTLLITLFPAVIIVLDPLSSSLFIVFALLGLYIGWRNPNSDPLGKDESLLLFSVVFFFAVALLAYIHGDTNYEGWKKLWRTFRFLFLIPIYLVVRRVADKELFWWSGLILAGSLCGIWAIAAWWWPQLEYLTQLSVLKDPAQFGGLALCIGFMALGSMGYLWRYGRWLILLPIASFVLAMIGAILGGTRGVWIAFPGMFLVFFYMVVRWYRWPQRLLVGGSVLLVFAVIYALPGTGVASAVTFFWRDILAMFNGTATGSVLLRWNLWQIAWDMFSANPVLGAGLGNFGNAVAQRVMSGELSVNYMVYENPLSELLHVLATRGLLGVLALALLFGIPLKHLIWAVRFRDAKMRHLGYAGLVLIVGYMHFIFVDSIFDRTGPIIFYTMSLAVIYGLLRARERAYLREPVRRQQSLSVIIICMDEADRIRATLESVHGWADEIVVLDSGSSDNTVTICREYSDKVFETDWPGFGKQKQRALDKASCEWVLSIDADEVVSAELRAEIDRELQEQPVHTGYDVHRPVIIFGRIMDFSGSGQSPLRLFKRTVGSFTQVPVHEKIVVSEGTMGRLRGSLYHETYRNYRHAVDKFSQYAVLQAGERFRKGKRATLIGAAVRGLLNFIHNYIVRFGFLDGGRGFVLAALHASYTFNKYANLWMLGLREKDARDLEE